MQFKYRLAYMALACVLLLSGVVLLINVRAQAPRQAQIVFSSDRDGNSEIYVMDVDGKNQRRLTNNPAGNGSAAWSPEGREIAFFSSRDGNEEIYVMDADGRNQLRLTNNRPAESNPAWSPDAQQIAFQSGLATTNMEIYVMDADGKNKRNLTSHPAHDTSPDWFDPAFAYAVEPASKLRRTWGWLKRDNK